MLNIVDETHINNYSSTISVAEAAVILQEECAELICAISKMLRHYNSGDGDCIDDKIKLNINEEIAHVLISIETIVKMNSDYVDEALIKNFIFSKELLLRSDLKENYAELAKNLNISCNSCPGKPAEFYVSNDDVASGIPK